jgi:hypothetical protein
VDAFTCVKVLDLNNPTALAAHSVDGVHAKAATTNEPRHHSLSHFGAPYVSCIRWCAYKPERLAAPSHKSGISTSAASWASTCLENPAGPSIGLQRPRDALSDIPGLLQLLQSISLTPLPERPPDNL